MYVVDFLQIVPNINVNRSFLVNFSRFVGNTYYCIRVKGEKTDSIFLNGLNT